MSFNNLNGWEPWMAHIYRNEFGGQYIVSAMGYVIPRGIMIHYHIADYQGTRYPCMLPPQNGKVVKHIAYTTDQFEKVTCPRCRVWLRDNIMLPRIRANKIIEASGEKQ